MTNLNILTAINAAEKSGLFAAMNAIKDQAPEVAETMLQNCVEHFEAVVDYLSGGVGESSIGIKFGCGNINSFELFQMVANQALEDLHIYVADRDVEPQELDSECILTGDRLLNTFTGQYEEIVNAYIASDLVKVNIENGSRFILPFGLKVKVKRSNDK